MKKQRVHTPLLLIGAIFFIIFSPINNKVKAAEDTTPFSQETHQYIDDSTHKYPEIKPYIDNTIEMFSQQVNINSEELDELLRESVDEAIKTQNIVESELKYLEQQYEVKNSLETFNAQPASMANSYLLARAAYDKGIGIVRDYGHRQTAAYMEHGIVPMGLEGIDWKPDTYFSIEDSWARRVATDDSLTGSFFGRFEQEIASKGKSYGVISDSHNFDYGEPATALNKVDYTATFTKRSDGTYKASIYVGDTFDFQWNINGYDNYAVNFGNNYAALMEDLGLIKPYLISIYSTM